MRFAGGSKGSTEEVPLSDSMSEEGSAREQSIPFDISGALVCSVGESKESLTQLGVSLASLLLCCP